MRIMVIGLGQMGLPIALNLLKAGHVVTGVDVAQESREAFAAAGGIARANTGDADAEVFITALASSKQVASIYLEPKGLIASAPKGSLFIDCSTIDISLARSLQTTACAAGHDVVTDRGERLAEIDRGSERVAPGIRPITGARQVAAGHAGDSPYTAWDPSASLPIRLARKRPSRASSIALARSPGVVAPTRLATSSYNSDSPRTGRAERTSRAET